MASRLFHVCMHALFILRPSFCCCIFVSHVCRLNRGIFSTFTSKFSPWDFETESKAAVMLAHMRRQLEIMPHFTHRYQHFREKKSSNKCNNEAQNGATKQPDLFFFFLQPFPVLPPSANPSVACSLCSRSDYRSHHPSLTPLFPPIRFSFPLNSLTLTHTRTSCTHTSLSYLWPWQPDCCLVAR